MGRATLLSLAAVACLTVGGCSSKTYKYRVAVIPKGLTHEHWQSVHRGAERAAADLAREQGITVEVLWDGPRRESDDQEQISLVDQKARMGIQGLVLAPQHSKNMVPPIERAAAKGIKVVIIDSGLDRDELKKNPSLMVKYVATNNYNGGRMGAEKLIEALEKAGKSDLKLVLFRYQVGSESTEQREQGFLDYVEQQKSKGKKVSVVSKDYYAGATVESAEKEAGPMLNTLRGEEVDGIFAVNESATTGLLNALISRQMNKKVKVVGFDSSDRLQQAVREGDVEGVVIQDPYRMGYLGVWVAVMALEGYDVAADGMELGTGEVFLTRDNIDGDDIRGRFDPAVQERRKVEVPTYKKK